MPPRLCRFHEHHIAHRIGVILALLGIPVCHIRILLLASVQRCCLDTGASSRGAELYQNNTSSADVIERAAKPFDGAVFLLNAITGWADGTSKHPTHTPNALTGQSSAQIWMSHHCPSATLPAACALRRPAQTLSQPRNILRNSQSWLSQPHY